MSLDLCTEVHWVSAFDEKCVIHLSSYDILAGKIDVCHDTLIVFTCATQAGIKLFALCLWIQNLDLVLLPLDDNVNSLAPEEFERNFRQIFF